MQPTYCIVALKYSSATVADVIYTVPEGNVQTCACLCVRLRALRASTHAIYMCTNMRLENQKK